MTEPDNLTLVMVGSLNDSDPWDVEVYARDDANAEGSTARWFLTGSEDTPTCRRVSWAFLLDSHRPLSLLTAESLR